MDVLVTGGTGVIGSPTVVSLLRRGHRVRLLSRHASEDLGAWPEEVTAFDGDLSDMSVLAKAMNGCDAVIHLAGIVSEHGEATFERVNVEGTRHVVEAARSGGVKRFIYVSSLGADTGRSAYHESKRRAEEVARQFPRQWVVLRPGNVYGPGDEVISLLLKMVRVLPVVPAIDGGDHQFQPMWVEDLSEVLALSVDHPDIVGRTMDLAGPERTSMNDLIDRLRRLTGRSPLALPVPGFLGVFGARALGLLGLHVPLDAGQIQMLEEGSVIEDPSRNALMSVFGLTTTTLQRGLEKLADSAPEQEPGHGRGSLVRRHVWADIVDSRFDDEALFEHFRARFAEITPWHVEVGAEPGTRLDLKPGATLTMHLPLRGNVQVRVVQQDTRSVTLATLEGHPLAGVVQFRVEALPAGALRFHVEVHDRPSNMADWVVMSSGGGALQVATWRTTVEHVIEDSGGSAPEGVQSESAKVRGEEAKRVEAWVGELLEARQRALHERGISDSEGTALSESR